MTDHARATPSIEDNAEGQRYEACLGDDLAGFLDYRRHPGRITLVHTEVDPAFEGRGIGAALAIHALEAARGAGEAVIPSCPFVRSYIRRHPEWLGVVAPGARRLVDEPAG